MESSERAAAIENTVVEHAAVGESPGFAASGGVTEFLRSPRARCASESTSAAAKQQRLSIDAKLLDPGRSPDGDR